MKGEDAIAQFTEGAEGNYFKSIKAIKKNINNSIHRKKIMDAEFCNISFKSRIALFLIKRNCIGFAFYFLNLCKYIKKILRKG